MQDLIVAVVSLGVGAAGMYFFLVGWKEYGPRPKHVGGSGEVGGSDY